MRNYMYIVVMAVTTYLIRVIPLAFLRKEIKNRTFRSFLTYVPYVTLAVMTFPAILDSTASVPSAVCGFGTALLLSYMEKSLLTVSLCSCGVVFVVEQIIL